MSMKNVGYIDLPEHRGAGGFDHADVHSPSDRLYVAHASNDAIDVIDSARDRHVESIPGLTAVAGALVSEARGLVFTSNRGENTVSVFAPRAKRDAFKIAVGVKPNGLAFDPVRGTLIAANVGDPSIPDSHSVSVVDLARRERIAEVKVLAGSDYEGRPERPGYERDGHQQEGTRHGPQGRGVVKKVDPAKGSVTLAHEPVKSMNWSAMTMGFTVKDKSLLDKLQAEKKVEFLQQGNDYVITGVK